MNQTSTDPLDAAFAQLRLLGLRRPRSSRMVAGVARGLAERFDIDPVLVRVGFVLLGMFFGFGITVYLIAWLLLPDDDGAISLERAIRDKDRPSILLCIVTAISVVSPPSTGQGGWIHTISSVLMLGGVVWFVVRHFKHTGAGADTPEGQGASTAGAPSAAGAPSIPAASAHTPMPGSSPTMAAPRYGSPTRGGTSLAFDPASGRWIDSPMTTSPDGNSPAFAAGQAFPAAAPVTHPGRRQRPPKLRRRPAGALLMLIAVGLTVVAATAGFLVANSLDPQPVRTPIAAAFALTAVSLALIGLGVAGRRAFLPGLLAVVLATTAVSTIATVDTPEIGDRTWSVVTADQLQANYSNGVGDSVLDLTAMKPTDLAGRSVDVSIGAGDLRVSLPTGVTANVEATGGFGDLTFPYPNGRSTTTHYDGTSQLTIGSGASTVAITIHVGAGDLTIEQGNKT